MDDLRRSQVQDIIMQEELVMPPFLDDMDDYMRCLEKIKETNYIDDNSLQPTCELPEAAVNTSMYYTNDEYEALKVEMMEKAKAAQTDEPDVDDNPGVPGGRKRAGTDADAEVKKESEQSVEDLKLS